MLYPSQLKSWRYAFMGEPRMRGPVPAKAGIIREAVCPLAGIALTTGARYGEIMTLRWPQVDFERRAIRLPKTNNGDARAIPLAPVVREELEKLKAIPRIDTDFVFPRRDGKHPIELRKHWFKAVKTAGLENFKFHDLRHTAASYLAISGATQMGIAAILGHRTLQMGVNDTRIYLSDKDPILCYLGLPILSPVAE